MDIVIELADHSVANVEVQKLGYMFPGQRSACYSADLLLRQYKRVKSEKGKAFSYRDIKKVYTIIFMSTVQKNFDAVRSAISIGPRKEQTLVSGLIFFRNTLSFRLTSSTLFCKIKVSETSWRRG